MAGSLLDRGVQPGQGVAIVLGNDDSFVSTFLGVQLAGAMAVPLNPLFNTEELRGHLAVGPVAGIVTTAATAAAISAASPSAWIATPADLVAAAPRASARATSFARSRTRSAPTAGGIDPSSPALFAFSSGSTGTPKGMIRTNANLTAEADQFAGTVGVDDQDVILAVIALFHAHGLGNALLASLRVGAPLVVGAFERDATLAAIRSEGVTIFPAVPFIFSTLAETRRARADDLASLRLCISAGAPLDDDTAARFVERFGVPIRQLYGCSEAGSVTIDLAVPPRSGSVGRPMAGIDLAVVDEAGRPLDARRDR